MLQKVAAWKPGQLELNGSPPKSNRPRLAESIPCGTQDAQIAATGLADVIAHLSAQNVIKPEGKDDVPSENSYTHLLGESLDMGACSGRRAHPKRNRASRRSRWDQFACRERGYRLTGLVGVRRSGVPFP